MKNKVKKISIAIIAVVIAVLIACEVISSMNIKQRRDEGVRFVVDNNLDIMVAYCDYLYTLNAEGKWDKIKLNTLVASPTEIMVTERYICYEDEDHSSIFVYNRITEQEFCIPSNGYYSPCCFAVFDDSTLFFQAYTDSNWKKAVLVKCDLYGENDCKIIWKGDGGLFPILADKGRSAFYSEDQTAFRLDIPTGQIERIADGNVFEVVDSRFLFVFKLIDHNLVYSKIDLETGEKSEVLSNGNNVYFENIDHTGRFLLYGGWTFADGFMNFRHVSHLELYDLSTGKEYLLPSSEVASRCIYVNSKKFKGI